MKNQKLIPFIIVFSLLLLSFASATQFEYTGNTLDSQASMSVTSDVFYTGTEYYYLQGARDHINIALKVVNNMSQTTLNVNQGFGGDEQYLAYSPETEFFLLGDYQTCRARKYATGSDFYNGTYLGSLAEYNLESMCGFPANCNIWSMNYNDDYFYIYMEASGQENMLCVLSDMNPDILFVAKYNVSSTVQEGEHFIDGVGLTSDRLNVLTDEGAVYIYSISGETIDENNLVDSYFPSEMKTGGDYRGTYVYDDAIYTWDKLTNIIYEHEYSGVINTTNFPYRLEQGEYYSTTQCFQQYGSGCLGDTSYYLCNNQTIFNDRDACYSTYGFTHKLETACNTQTAIEYCVSGCSTKTAYDAENDLYYYYGACEPADCSNECTSKGFHCVTGTARRYCDTDYDSDNCLEYSGLLECGTNEYCTNGECEEFNFSRTNNELTIPDFSIIYYGQDDITSGESTMREGTEYSYDDFTNVLQVETTNREHVQLLGYDPHADIENYLYSGVDCNYIEKTVASFTTSENLINVSGSITIDGDGDEVDRGVNDWWLVVENQPVQSDYLNVTYALPHSNTEMKMVLDFFDTDTDRVIVTWSDESGNEILKFAINESDDTGSTLTYTQLNISNGEVLTIFEDTGTGGITALTVEVLVDHINEVWTLHTINERTGETTEHFSVPLEVNLHEHDILTVKVEVTDGDGFYMKNFSLTQMDKLPLFNENYPNDYNSVCTFSNGCQTVRMYVNVEDTPVYHAYDDLEICVDLTTSLGRDNSGLEELTKNEKYIYTVGILFVILLFFGMIGFATENTTVGIGAGTLVGLGWLIVAVLIGWIPAYILVIMIVLTAFVIARVVGKAVGG